MMAMTAAIRNRPIATIAIPAVLIAEVVVLRAVSEGRFGALSGAEGLWSDLATAHDLAKILFVILGITATVGLFDNSSARRPSGGVVSMRWVLLHAAVFLAFICALIILPAPGDAIAFTAEMATAYASAVALFILWQLSSVALVVGIGAFNDPRRITWLLVALGLTAALSYWWLGWRGSLDLRIVWLLLVVTLILSASGFRRLPFNLLSLATLALVASAVYVWQSSLNNSDVIIELRSLIEGTTLTWSLEIYRSLGFVPPAVTYLDGLPVIAYGDFAIRMAAQCAGYQGMLSATVFLGGFIALEARRLRLGRAVVLLAVAVLAVFTMNAVRIALLLYIGIHISPEVAVNGFHSHFGVLSLFAVVGAAMLVLQLPPFRRAAVRPMERRRAMPTATQVRGLAILMLPLAATLSASILVGVFSGGFNWLYPVPALVGVAVLWRMRPAVLGEFVPAPGLAGFACGVVAFVIWIAMIPPDVERSQELVEALAAVPWPLAAVWIAFRVFGSSVVVPITEELAFRAGLLRLVERGCGPLLGRGAALAVGVAASSVAFGVLHADVLAATVVGVLYGVLAVWRGNVGEAIIAHAVTNFLIAVYALGFGQWSYW